MEQEPCLVISYPSTEGFTSSNTLASGQESANGESVIILYLKGFSINSIHQQPEISPLLFHTGVLLFKTNYYFFNICSNTPQDP